MLKSALLLCTCCVLLAAETAAPTPAVAYAEDFDADAALPAGWTTQGSVALSSEIPYSRPHALILGRTQDEAGVDTSASGPAFAVSPGLWILSGSERGMLVSPDSSFCLQIALEVLAADGTVAERHEIAAPFGEHGWRSFRKQVEIPARASQARFVLTMRKTHGSIAIDSLKAAPVAGDAVEKVIERIVLSSAATGNLFLPDDDVRISARVETLRPLQPEDRTLRAVVRDYWGAELLPPMTLTLEADGEANQRFIYRADIVCERDRIELYRYHELHTTLTPARAATAAQFTGFARLPVAEAQSHPAERIPFSIRNWDSRIPEYFRLAARIGHRHLGVWGGWDAKDPTKVHLPGVDLCEQLNVRWITGTPASRVEDHGFRDYSEENLRQGMVNFLKAYGKRGLTAIAIGNEPNENPAKVAEKVQAYKAIYEAAKSYDPNIFVIATSVPALDSFFEAGYHHYCDAYDFHVYETYQNVREGVRRYKAMMAKYQAPKPIWCTELGLNSQGMTRHAVASELVKKVTAFFAEGGANVSWFTIMYPDKDGKARGTSGDAHNTFDAAYNQYNPRLDAIAYYTMINSIAIKAFVDEVQHEDGVQGYLFRDEHGDCLQILWRDSGRADRAIRLPGVDTATLIRIDGSRTTLTPMDGQVTLGISAEPILLRYTQVGGMLPRSFGTAQISVAETDSSLLAGGSTTLTLRGPGLDARTCAVLAPPNWTVALSDGDAGTVLAQITAPADTEARVGRIHVRRLHGDAIHGEIITSITLRSPIASDLLAVAGDAEQPAGVTLTITNQDRSDADVSWSVDIVESFPMTQGSYRLQDPQPVTAFLVGEREGQVRLAAGESRRIRLALADHDPLAIYRIRSQISDARGRSTMRRRLVGGFATAMRSTTPVAIDGILDDAVWQQPPAITMGEAVQFLGIGSQNITDKQPWKGPDDLSARWRAAWDDGHLYLAVEVTDDVHRVLHADGHIWNQDGLQFLFDALRTSAEKPGKYDISIGRGTAGPQAWYHLSAHSSVPTGAAKDIRVIVADGSEGSLIYEIAIPWTGLAPFAPRSGANLGMAMIINEDDGPGREGALAWFSGVHSKQLDLVGDLILVE